MGIKKNDEIIGLTPAHLHRCYNEAASEERVLEMQRISMDILMELKGG
ncbi:MAG: hypothetical protein U9P12_02345 [Verrucomicrobiota bacterium]|nr:hypothetical protein [Verrucomicrobiota bacterium]